MTINCHNTIIILDWKLIKGRELLKHWFTSQPTGRYVTYQFQSDETESEYMQIAANQQLIFHLIHPKHMEEHWGWKVYGKPTRKYTHQTHFNCQTCRHVSLQAKLNRDEMLENVCIYRHLLYSSALNHAPNHLTCCFPTCSRCFAF